MPAGQSTQMIVGAKRVFYSAFVNVNLDESLPGIGQPPPLKREHRLYQADFLMRFYGFKAGELLSEDNQSFNDYIDPKCQWAVGHLECFPVEIMTADYYTLLRVPGIGTNSVRRIIKARKHAKLSFTDL